MARQRGATLGRVRVARAPIRIQRKVTRRVVRGIGHQPQVRQRIASGKTVVIGASKHKVGRVHIASGQPEHVIQLRQCAHDAASGFERAAKIDVFARIGQPRIGQPLAMRILPAKAGR